MLWSRPVELRIDVADLWWDQTPTGVNIAMMAIQDEIAEILQQPGGDEDGAFVRARAL
jgi:hypothetical protein